ncbi:hypothetical protein [Georgenia satyanarayanai]|uniref:hypothetical protein n=1 Tax=Georgenia satyanarayanai TaxID=860221 RepID=UPI00126576EE|nr:hypothetical protein [Georgenia satyanarayanai]
MEVRIVTYLALTHRTPYATRRLETWALNAHEIEEADRVVRHVRDYLRPGSDESSQSRAFEFTATTAETCLKHFDSILASHASAATLPTDVQEELEQAVSTLNHIADQVYFASGAYNGKRDGQPVVVNDEIKRFAERAVPVLVTCSGTRAAPIVHHAAETLIYLAPLDERRALLALSKAITKGGEYASDSISSNVVVPHLKRLLAEHRHLVLFDPQGVVAFRQLLAAFAAAGSEPALELAFTFAEVFR